MKSHDMIERWVERARSNPDDCAEIHIDKIDARWKTRSNWIEGARQAFEDALALEALIKSRSLVLSFTLTQVSGLTNLSFGSSSELLSQLDEKTPPSLYLFPLGGEPWNDPKLLTGTSLTKMSDEESSLVLPAMGAIGLYWQFPSPDSKTFLRSLSFAKK